MAFFLWRCQNAPLVLVQDKETKLHSRSNFMCLSVLKCEQLRAAEIIIAAC